MIAIIIICVVAVIIIAAAILHIARSRASSLILIFLAQSLLIRNINPDRRPDYIIRKSLEHKNAIPWFVRPLSVWYINNNGISIATRMLRFILTNLKEDENIELNE